MFSVPYPSVAGLYAPVKPNLGKLLEMDARADFSFCEMANERARTLRDGPGYFTMHAWRLLASSLWSALMVGPVFLQDMLIAGRRGRQQIFRWIYAGWLILQVCIFSFFVAVDLFRPSNSYFIVLVSERFVATFTVQQMILLVLAVPVFAASAIADEKTRGTLQYLLTTEIEGRHIILGKLLARSAQALVLLLTGLPLYAFLGALAGLDPPTMLALIGVTFIPLLAIASATLLASVWCKQTRHAVLTLYAAGLLGFLAVYFLGGPLRYFDPLYVFDPFRGQGDTAQSGAFGERLVGSVVAWGLLGGVCLVLAMWRLRPAYLQQLENAGRQPKLRRWGGARLPVSDNLIHWREQQVEGLAPLRSLRVVPRWLGLLLVSGVTALSSAVILVLHLAPLHTIDDVLTNIVTFDPVCLSQCFEPEVGGAFLFQALIAMLLASMVVGIRCSGAIVGERERGTWEALLLTPITARKLVRGKLWAIMGASYIYLAAYAIPAIGASALTCGAALFWTVIGLAVTLLAMYYLGAAGMYCSVRATTSWRSLLSTLGLGYLGGFILFLSTSPVIGFIAFIIMLLLALIETVLQPYTQVSLMPKSRTGVVEFITALYIASFIALALMFWLVSKYFFVKSTQKWIAQRERVRYWEEEPDLPSRRWRRIHAPR
jgi:ABC-type Na+ efflux pump permease subunit